MNERRNTPSNAGAEGNMGPAPHKSLGVGSSASASPATSRPMTTQELDRWDSVAQWAYDHNRAATLEHHELKRLIDMARQSLPSAVRRTTLSPDHVEKLARGIEQNEVSVIGADGDGWLTMVDRTYIADVLRESAKAPQSTVEAPVREWEGYCSAEVEAEMKEIERVYQGSGDKGRDWGMMRDLAAWSVRGKQAFLSPSSSIERIEDNICAGHADAWFCGRNHLPAGFDNCIVCCFEEAWKRQTPPSAIEEPKT